MNTPIQISIKEPGRDVLPTPLRRSTSALILMTLALACFAFSSAARAVLPAPGGGYPGNNTAGGDNALLSLTTGFQNTAIGSNALVSLATGFNNTAIGFNALYSDTEGRFNTATGSFALMSSTSAFFNTATGSGALMSNTTG